MARRERRQGVLVKRDGNSVGQLSHRVSGTNSGVIDRRGGCRAQRKLVPSEVIEMGVGNEPPFLSPGDINGQS